VSAFLRPVEDQNGKAWTFERIGTERAEINESEETIRALAVRQSLFVQRALDLSVPYLVLGDIPRFAGRRIAKIYAARIHELLFCKTRPFFIS